MQKFTLKQPVEAMFWRGLEDNARLKEFCDMWASVEGTVYVTTRDGATNLKPGEYVVKGLASAFTVVSSDHFAKTFTVVSTPCDQCGKDIPDGEEFGIPGDRGEHVFCSQGCCESYIDWKIDSDTERADQ